jgi:hypothetical protein
MTTFVQLPRTLPERPYDLDFTSKVFNRLSKFAIRTRWLPSSRRYNLTVCHEKRFLWFRVAKTGTRTILHLMKHSGIHLDAEHPMDVHYPVRVYANYFKFAFVRNPWDRLVSCWHNKIVDQNWWGLSDKQRDHLRNFDNFIDYISKLDLETCDVHLRLQSSVIDLNHVDYIARFENFETDLKTIFDILGLKITEIPKANASKSRTPIHAYYNSKLRDKVEQLYQKDIQIFGYEYK